MKQGKRSCSKALSRTWNHVSCQECLWGLEVTSLCFHLFLLRKRHENSYCFPSDTSFFSAETVDRHKTRIICVSFEATALFSPSLTLSPRLLYNQRVQVCCLLFCSIHVIFSSCLASKNLVFNSSCKPFESRRNTERFQTNASSSRSALPFAGKEEERRGKKKRADKQDNRGREEFLPRIDTKSLIKSLKGLRIWAVSVFYWWTK